MFSQRPPRVGSYAAASGAAAAGSAMSTTAKVSIFIVLFIAIAAFAVLVAAIFIESKKIIVIRLYIRTSLPKVIWEEGRVAALSDTYAVKAPLITMARPKFASKSTSYRGPIPKSHYVPYPWTRPTYDATPASGSDPPFFPQCTGYTAVSYTHLTLPTNREV